MTRAAMARPPSGASLARRAVEVLREEGLRGLWGRGLATVAYRRVTVLVKDAGAGAVPPTTEGLEIGRIGTGDIDEYRRLRPDTPVGEVRRRLGAGQICVLARLDGEPVACRWYSLGRAEIPYLGFAFELPEDLAYVHDAFTAPWARGRGLSPPVRAHGEALLRDLGTRGFLAAVMRENTAGIALTLAAGFAPAGHIAVIRLPGRRVLLRDGRLQYLGAAQPLAAPWSSPPPGPRAAANRPNRTEAADPRRKAAL